MSAMRIKRVQPCQLISIPKLIKRLPKEFPVQRKMEIEERLYRIQAGFAGELRVDRYLESIQCLDSKIILTDVRLPTRSGGTFQIDTLIISQKYILILEVKNIKGDLYFKTDPHFLLREVDGIGTRMECPITQLEVAQFHLVDWLRRSGINMEVRGEIILSNQSAFIKEIPEKSPVMYMKRLMILLQDMEKLPVLLNEQQIRIIATQIKTQQSEYTQPPLCTTFQIDPNQLKIGQLCKSCNGEMVYRTERMKFCTNCQTEQPSDYGETVADWFLLIDSSMTSAQCRYFLNLKGKQQARYILNFIGLPKAEGKRDVKYYWPE